MQPNTDYEMDQGKSDSKSERIKSLEVGGAHNLSGVEQQNGKKRSVLHSHSSPYIASLSLYLYKGVEHLIT